MGYYQKARKLGLTPFGAPENGQITSSIVQVATNTYVLILANGETTRPNDDGSGQSSINGDEKEYMLNWLFKYGSNPEPPTSFSDSSSLNSYRDVATNYKLYNRFQIKYVIDESGDIFESSTQPYVFPDSGVRIGSTIDPVNQFIVPGEAGPNNGAQAITEDKYYHNVVDGTPDTAAVSAFNTLMAPDLWNNIGCRITFGVEHGWDYEIVEQAYPTYTVYEKQSDGSFDKVDELDQAASPSAHFNSNPYPSGPAAFVDVLP